MQDVRDIPKCVECEKRKEFMESNKIKTYEDYQNLDLDIINEFRDCCENCSEPIADLITYEKLKIYNRYNRLLPGTGRTSRFSEDDIQHMKALRNENGMSWGKVAKYYGISRNTLLQTRKWTY